MSTPPQGEPFSQAGSIAPSRRTGVEDSTDPLLGLSGEVLPERWRTRLQGLQDWICELLIKNQQLRVALMEMKAREPEDDCSGNV
jgi:hypothetical protein